MLAAVFFAAGIALTDGNAVFLLFPIVSLPFLRRDLALWLALCALFAFGVCSFSLARARTSVFSFAAGEYELVGTIEEIGADSVTLTGVTLNGERADSDVIAYVEGELRIGDEISGSAWLSPVAAEEASDVAGHVKYRASLEDCQVSDGSFSLFRLVRREIYEALFSHLEGESAAVAYALMIGSTDFVSEGVLTQVRYGGVAHIFAVSGLHIGIVYAGLTGLLRLLKCNGAAAFVLSVSGIVLYAGVCDFTASSMRAVAMCSVLGCNRLLGRKHDGLNALGYAVIFVLLFSPGAYFTVGFRLSVLACLGIILYADRFARLRSPIAASFGVTASAQAFTFPVLIDVFGYCSAPSLLLNLILVPLVAPLMGALFVGVIGCMAGASFCMLPAAGILKIFLWLVSLADFSKLLFCGFAFGLAALPYYASLLVASGLFRLSARMRARLSLCLAAACVAALTLSHPPFYEVRLASNRSGVAVRAESASLLVVTRPYSAQKLLFSVGLTEADAVLFLCEEEELTFAAELVYVREDVEGEISVRYLGGNSCLVSCGGYLFSVNAPAAGADAALSLGGEQIWYVIGGRLWQKE